MRARGVCSRNRLLGVCLSLLCMEALHPALAQPAAMVKDINTTLDPTFSGTVVPLARGSLVNTATVATTAGVVDSNPANNSATDTDALTPQADLSVSMTDSPDPVNQGATLTYSLTIANAGPSTATGIVLTDTLPAGVTFVSATPGSPTCTQAAGTVTCNLANIAPGSSTPVTILVRPNAGTVGTVTNMAAVSETETDLNGANNSASTQTTVPGPSPARNLLVTGRTTTSVSLKWTDPQGAETGFRLERSTNGTSWSAFDIVGPDVTTYTDTLGSPATLYYYRVIALQSGVGEAPPSNVAAETTFSTTAAKVCAAALATSGTSIGKPSVARGASQWAMAWHERPAGEMSTHVYFQKLDDATGAFVGSRVRVSSSTGSSSNPTLRWNGTNYGVLWAESMKAPTGESTSQWRFALLDAAGARLKGDISAIPAGRSVRSGPRAEMPLVWNGSGWGIFTNEEGTPPSDLAFYRLDANGYPVGSRIQLSSTPDWELSQSAVWNGTEYGLAWVRSGTAGGSFQVYFQRVSAGGALLGSPSLLWSNTTASSTSWPTFSTSVLWDGASWVVAFTDYGPDPEAPEPVYLRRLNPDGSVAGAAVRLSPDYDPDFAPGDLVPIYDDSPLLLARPGGYEVFTTSFLNSVANWAICAYQADGSLNRVGSRAVVSVNDGRSSAGARVATDGTRYLVAYDETRLGSNELADLLVGNSGLLAGPTSLTAGHINGGANPVALPLGDGFAALWTDTSTGTAQIRAKLYDGTGTLVATRAPLSSRSVRGKPGSVSVGTTFALAWKDASNTLVFGRYDATGAALISESVVATGAGGPPYVGMAFSGESYGLAFAKGKNVLFQRVAPSGSLVGSPTTVTTVTGTTLLGQPGLQIQWVGTGWALLWRQDGNTDSDLFYAFLDPSGAVVTPPIQVTFTPQAENGFQLLWNGSVLALTWYDYRYPDPPGGVILFTVLDLGGIKAFAPVVVVATPYDDTYPSLYWDQDRFRLVHFAGSPGTLREIAVFPNGTVAPGERMLAPRGGPNGIAWNGATLGVAWAQLGEIYFETTACLVDATPPPCPSATVSGDASSITVSFSPVTDPESGIWRYDVYRDGAMVAELLPTITSYVDGGNLPGVAHVYEVRALNGAYLESSGCSVVSLCPAAPIAANGGPYCAGATVALTASSISGATYAWTGPNSFASAVQNPTIPSATMAATGLYSVTATLNGCTSPVGSTTVVVNAMPATPVIAAPGSVFANAAGLTASVTIHSDSTYSWGITNGTITAGALSSQVTFTAGPTGPVVLTAVETSVSGCHSSQASVSIPVLTGSTRFNPVAPCRLFDTRNAGGTDAALPALAAGETRTFVIGSRCGLPASAKSLSVNQTVTGPTAPGVLLLYRADLPSAPTASSLSFRAGITRANNGMLELAHDGSGTFKVFNNSSGTVHFILDVNGYFQ